MEKTEWSKKITNEVLKRKVLMRTFLKNTLRTKVKRVGHALEEVAFFVMPFKEVMGAKGVGGR